MTNQSRIEHGAGGTAFVGAPAVEVFRAIVIANGLKLYARTGIKPNRAYTPSAMMRVAAEITGQKFKARDYLGAADALSKWADEQRAKIPTVIRMHRGPEHTVTDGSGNPVPPPEDGTS